MLRRDARWAWAMLSGLYFIVAAGAHLRFSIWLVSPRQTPFGPFAFSQLVAPVALLALAWLLHHAWRSLRAGGNGVLAGCWLAWGLAVLAVDRTLTYSLNELAHYPQYALLAWLSAHVLDPRRERRVVGRLMFCCGLLGALDELQQYVWIAADYGDYFDFNDLVVNQLGAALGAMLYYRPDRVPALRAAAGRPWAAVAVALLLVLLVLAALGSDRLRLTPSVPVPPGGLSSEPDGRTRLYLQREPQAYGSRRKGYRRPTYRVLTPLEGIAAASLAGGFFALVWPLGLRSGKRSMLGSADKRGA